MDKDSIDIVGISELIVRAEANGDSLLIVEDQPQVALDAVAAKVLDSFQVNRDAKRRSGIEDAIKTASLQYNGEYSSSELAQIKQDGSAVIYMNLTATKCRAAASWIRDILLSAKQKSWSIRPTPKVSLPPEIEEMIRDAILREFEILMKPEQEQQGQEGAPQNTEEAQNKVRELNQNKRDIEEAIYEELNREAAHSMIKMERQINDQLTEGGWYDALSQFIDDIVVYPAAFMKGPIVVTKKKIEYENGVPKEESEYCYKNRRVSPFDIYTSPSAVTLQDGDLHEHIRLTPYELQSLIGVDDYKTNVIGELLMEGPDATSYHWLDTGVEDDKAEEEKRGDSDDANKGLYHGLHFFGSISKKDLVDFGFTDPKVLSAPDYMFFECEAIVIGKKTIKCVINDDPLLRRPYYTACYQKRPGTLWGRSLPDLMRDIQRMCNATARALANNMALAAGPQIEVYVQRLVDQTQLEGIRPFKIWQLDVDPTGAGGRAVNFFQPTSNANELLTVYKEFEQKADDATGIPRYAYGNEKSGQAAATAQGLSLLLESASKGIKDVIRNIDSGVIIPRVERQFYENIMKNELSYTGDVVVDAIGSSTLTIKGAEQLKRNEFLQFTANPTDQGIMGIEGRANLLREMAKDLGFSDPVVPSRLDLKKQQKDNEKKQQAAMQSQMQMEQQKQEASLAATKLQVDGQMQMNQMTQEVKAAIEQMKDQRKALDQQIAALSLQLKKEAVDTQASLKSSEIKADSEKQFREIALKMQSGEGI